MWRSKPNESSPPIDGPSLYALIALARGRILSSKPASWPTLLTLAQRERVLGLTWSRSGASIRSAAPSDVSARWQRQALAQGLQAQRQLDQLGRTVARLSRDGIAVVVLKGAPLAQRLYADYSVRPTVDADLYIPVEQRLEGARILADLGWRLTSAQWPEEEKFELRIGDECLALEVHSSAIDDASLDHIHIPIEAGSVEVGGYELPAHSGALLPAYLASHLVKHHERPLLWALDVTTLWESLGESERDAARRAASRVGLSRHLDWAVRLAESIGEVSDRGLAAERALRTVQRALATRGDFGRVAQLVALSSSPAAAFRVIGGRVWPPAWRQGWREAPRYFAHRAVAWAYRHLVFELPTSSTESAVHEPSLSFDDEDCARLLMATLTQSRAVWVSSVGQSMAPAIPLFGSARIVSVSDGAPKIGDVVAIRSSERQCTLERVLRLEGDGIVVKPDAHLTKEHRVPRDAILGICDMVQVGGSLVPIERRPHGNLGMMRAIVRSRFATRSAALGR
jgi:hypothetical protein